jgi:hypothetical protein
VFANDHNIIRWDYLNSTDPPPMKPQTEFEFYIFDSVSYEYGVTRQLPGGLPGS